MTRAAPALATALPAAAYEALRAAVLSGRSSGQRGLAILIHRGLAAWIGETKPEEAPPSPGTTRSAVPTTLMPATGELTRVLAGIILALSTESAHVRP